MSDPYLSRDPYLLVAEQADDRTILNMLSVNKYFYDNGFFERLMRKRYPLLTKYKQEKESWRHFYVRMIHYVSLLKEYASAYKHPNESWDGFYSRMIHYILLLKEFSIPYIPHKDFDPAAFYTRFRTSPRLALEIALGLAAEIGDRKLVDILIKTGARDLNMALSVASFQGHKDLVIDLIQKGAKDLNWAMANAAYTGHADIVLYLIDQGASNFSVAEEKAFEGGQHEIISLLRRYRS